MARVVGIHELVLKDGVTEEEFEALVAEYKASVSASPPDVSTHIMKRVRGGRTGTYIEVFEFASQEALEYHFPGQKTQSAEVQQWLKANAAVIEKLVRVVGSDIHIGDYVEL